MESEALILDPPLTPLTQRLLPLEFEAQLPSVRCQVACAIRHSTGSFMYEATDVWFSREDITRFLTELEAMTRGTGGHARLHDLSEAFVLTLTQQGRKTQITLGIFETSPDGTETKLSLSATADNDLPAWLLSTLREQGLWGEDHAFAGLTNETPK